MDSPVQKTWLISLPRARAWSTVAAALVCLAATFVHAEESESSKVTVPLQTGNPHIETVATLYEKEKHEEAQSRLKRALEYDSNGDQELVWLKLMQGVLQEELGQAGALESFKEALALDKEAQLPVQGKRRLRKLFEQARATLAQPADEELLARELEQRSLAQVSGPPARRQGWSVGVRGELDVLALGVAATESDESLGYAPVAPSVSLGYTREKLGGALTLVVQPSPALRAEGQYHPFTLGWVRPYARLGATAFFRELDAQEKYTFFGGVSGRGALGVDVQWTSRLYAFADVAYEHFLTGEARYRSQSVLISVGVGLFP